MLAVHIRHVNPGEQPVLQEYVVLVPRPVIDNKTENNN